MVKLSNIATDPALEASGAWATYVPGFDVLIRSSASREYRDAREKAIEPYLPLIRLKKANEADLERIVAELTATHLIADWRGLEGDDGAPIAYSPDEAKKVTTDPRWHRFEEWVRAQAGNDERYRAQIVETAVGN